jgi:hypothetical protein
METAETDEMVFDFPSPTVVAVDDDEEELKRVRKGLEEANIPCLPVLYEDEIKRPLTLHQGVRILFLDINLLGSQEDSPIQTKAGVLADVIKQLVSRGPWMLIFWTNYPDEADGIMELFRDRGRFPELPLPMAYRVLDKHFVKNAGGPSSPGAVQTLKKEIAAMLAGQPVAAILQWERRVARAAADSLSVVYDLAVATEPDNIAEAFNSVLGGIAKEALGKEAETKPYLAAERGLFPLLLDRIVNMPPSEEYVSLWEHVLKDGAGRLISFPRDIDRATLNSHFLIHVDDSLSKDQRGVWVECAADTDDDGYFYDMFGLRRNQLLEDFITFQGHRVDGRRISRAEKREKRKLCRIGLLEASAECDHAWKKLKIYRYVLCVLIPEELEPFSQFTNWCPVDTDYKCSGDRHEGIHPLPKVKVGDRTYLIKVNFRFALGLSPKSKRLGRPLFRLRRDVAADVSFRCSQFWTRTGILSFKE